LHFSPVRCTSGTYRQHRYTMALSCTPCCPKKSSFQPPTPHYFLRISGAEPSSPCPKAESTLLSFFGVHRGIPPQFAQRMSVLGVLGASPPPSAATTSPAGNELSEKMVKTLPSPVSFSNLVARFSVQIIFYWSRGLCHSSLLPP